jgi:hypothetical protein
MAGSPQNLGVSHNQVSACSASAAAGGASLFALGAGALLVAGGLVARRFVR